MTIEQFWDGDPNDFGAYWDAYEQRKRQEAEEANVRAFNQGQYFLFALAHCLQFSKHPKQIYPKKPFPLGGDNKPKLTQKEYEEIRKIQMQRLAKRFEK